ncbi:MAG: hypothetical protein KA191_15680 [Verrucomicrobia bacterium]|nr:hypothetical protein [Verrucomicrobiota bacterium]OQC65271.1 MAG: hypothetical protein BWX48_02626 [Verrucomicrobia bacterium ADurb.Bin006]HOA62528.1 hypothetical protein [Verrucomicrobiota bacterium]HOF49470.1 hypothetical protein [Verrucomicrobiota bacterium]HOG88127.1 hypothetical protein [Verrucomicrobiota bacterium]
MPRTQFSATDLKQLRHQLDRWRQCQSGTIRLPQALWTSAATLALTHGVGTVARTLRLDYNKLKRQVAAAAGALPLAPVSFVEVQPPECMAQAATLCRIELCDRAGAKMTLELPCDPATVVGVAQAFWRRA